MNSESSGQIVFSRAVIQVLAFDKYLLFVLSLDFSKDSVRHFTGLMSHVSKNSLNFPSLSILITDASVP